MRVNSNQTMLYINDGVYGSFNCLLFDHASVTPIPLKVIHEVAQNVYRTNFIPSKMNLLIALLKR